MNDLAMTCSDFVNALKMLICSVKHYSVSPTIATCLKILCVFVFPKYGCTKEV